MPELQAKNAHYKGEIKRLGANRPKNKGGNDFSLEEI
jgi:hypothetical protein